MNTFLPADPAHVATMQRYARAAGVAMLLSIIFGFLGEMYLPGQIIVRGDAAATAANIRASPTLFRLTFASYLVEGICDVMLLVFFYILLKPVDRNLALLSAFFGIVSMVTFAIAQSSFFAASLILRDTGGMTAFTAQQREALALLATRLASMIAWLFVCMYGIASMIRGYLIARSGYLPRVLGILLVAGGAGFLMRSVTYIIAPSLSSPLLLLPMALAGIPLMAWLLFRGVGGTRPTTSDAA
ncbi:MAG TPA: DUF4386 domain-containing protein [Thermoanaerobaculia bacterium]|nr:DUF4386 domain-containing protein [Thermoanaerobaculia bacterium]